MRKLTGFNLAILHKGRANRTFLGKIDKMLAFLLLGLVFPFSHVYSQKDKEGCQEHQILPSRIPGYHIGNCEQNDFSAHTVLTSKGERTIEGKKTVLQYFLNEGAIGISETFVRKNYMDAIKKQGAKIEYEQHGRGVGMVQQPDGTTFWVDVTGYVGDGSPEQTEHFYLVIIEIAPMEQVITAKTMGDDLKQTGRSVLYIQFETGKATIKNESLKMVEQMANYLNANKSVKVYIVGHTDNDGTLDFNMKLSEQRAVSVVQALVNQYKVQPAQITAKGAGPLAPVASNFNENGKKLNRRVEMVLQ
jgi:OmpA-OmpF porin, OOP family